MTKEQYYALIHPYSDALSLVLARLEVLNHQTGEQEEFRPIHGISSRIKDKDSIEQKLKKKHAGGSPDDAKALLHDIAGIRVICFFERDIRHLADRLKKQSDLIIIREKDYINTPKSNGYRSLHMIVQVPVFLSQGRLELPVEVQIRTVAMDYWAELEHQLRYKQEVPDEGEITAGLKACAEASIESIGYEKPVKGKVGAIQQIAADMARIQLGERIANISAEANMALIKSTAPAHQTKRLPAGAQPHQPANQLTYPRAYAA